MLGVDLTQETGSIMNPCGKHAPPMNTRSRVDHPRPIRLIQMNLHQVPAFTKCLKFTCCVPEPVMKLYVLYITKPES